MVVFWRIFDIFLVVKIITKKMKNIVIYSSMLLALFLLVWAIIDIVKRKPQNMVIWVILCLILPSIGPIIYFQWQYWSHRRTKQASYLN